MRSRFFLILILSVLGIVWANAQQDPMFTNYQFNGLAFNPAYAGSKEHLSINLVHRQQWLGFEGAPISQSLTAHMPFKSERIGVGFSMLNDKIGPTQTFNMSGAYAYRLLVGSRKTLKLSFGIQASIANWHADWFDVIVEHGSDPSFQKNVTRWFPNFGAGLYLQGERFYAGLGCPNIIEHELRDEPSQNVDYLGKTFRHLYAACGFTVPLRNEQVVFRSSVLVKSVGLFSTIIQDGLQKKIGAPSGINLDASFFFRQTFWLGTTYHTAVQFRKSSGDSLDLWGSWHFRNGLRIGGSYGITLSKIQKAAGNSFELMVGYEFDIKVNKVASPRYF